jgi:hypothetical protein
MKPSTEIVRLNSLRDDSEARAAYAASLLRPAQSRLVLQAALDVLQETPVPEARPALLAIYEHLAGNGPKRDPGAFLRRAVLDALRPIVLPADGALLAQGVAIYEFLPPEFKEEAGLLRGSALVALNELDHELAGYHAARLLVDEYTEEMSGEPALTAARVLASQEQWLPLYQAAMLGQGRILPEVVSECLRSLAATRAELVPAIVERFGDATNPAILVGLFDLLIQHAAGPQALQYLEESLARLQDPDLFRYLLIAMLSARHAALNELSLRSARFETNQAKIAVHLEALSLFDLGADGEQLSEQLHRRARPRR